MKNKEFFLLLIFIVIFMLVACSSQSEQNLENTNNSNSKSKVVATTTIIGDIVNQVGADHIVLDVLLPTGTDPHGFNPTPQDIAKVANADLVFANGADLEEFLDYLLESAGAEEKVIFLSDGIELKSADTDSENDHQDKEHDHQDFDPHTWTAPNNVMIWLDSIQHALGTADPLNAQVYVNNADGYEQQLQELDTWIRKRIAEIPEENRKLVTDHALFGYLAEQYGFEQVGTLIPGYSTLSEPSAKDLAAMEDTIQDLEVKAIFVGKTVNPTLAERVVEDTGTRLVFVYTGSLSDPDGEAGTYMDYMRYNINAFVDALAP